MLNFLQANNIMDVAGLDEKFKSMIGEQLDIQGKLKPVERRLATLKKHRAVGYLFQVQGEKEADRSRANPVCGGAGLPQRRDERQDHHSDKGMESGVCQADRRAERAQSAVSCAESGSERSRADTKERLQYLAAGTEGTGTQGAGYGEVTDRH